MSNIEKKKYKLMYHKYSMFEGKYVYIEKIIETNDIYHEIGKLICNEISDIKRISYKEVKDE